MNSVSFVVKDFVVFLNHEGHDEHEAMEFEAISRDVIGAAIEVHRHLGPGLLESTYLRCLARELSLNNIEFEIEKPLPVRYKDEHLDCGYRIDLIAGNALIVEVKSVNEVHPIHEAQLLTYMKLSEIRIGLLINFNVTRLKDGIKRFVL